MGVKRKSSIKKKSARLCGFMLALCMVVTAIPTLSIDVYAAPGDPEIKLGTAGIPSGDMVYFGKYNTYDVPWIVLENGKLSEATTTATKTLPLLSKYLLGNSNFRLSGTGYYSGSDLQTTMNTIYGGFDIKEQTAVAATTLNGNSMYGGQADSTDQKLFPLSEKEAEGLTGSWESDILKASNISAPADGAAGWWLRSSFDDSSDNCVHADGTLDFHSVNVPLGVRPAFHLNLSSVLFTSAAAGGKSGFAAVGSNTTNEWKLTLKDASTGFNATLPTEGNAGESITVTVTGTGSGTTHTQTSAMLVNGSGTVVAYGKIGETTKTEITFTIPSTIPTGEYTLKVFREQVNGDYKTDYAGDAVQKTIQITGISSGGASQIRQEEIERPDLWREFIKATLLKIGAAKEGETITIDFGGFNALTLSVMKQMAMRRDLTVKMVYYYKGAQYNLTFPAGMPIKYQDDIRYYGPLKLADMANRDGGACSITQ